MARSVNRFSRLTAQRHGGRKAGVFQGRTVAEGQGRPNLGRLSRLTSSRHGGRRAGTFFGRGGTATSFVAAQGNCNTDGLQGRATVAASMVAASGSSTTSALSTGSLANRPNFAKFSRLTSSRHAGRRAGYFARLATGIGAFVAAAGSSTTGTLYGASEGLGRTVARFSRVTVAGWATKRRGSFTRTGTAGNFVSAFGSSQTSALAGARVFRASFTVADGVATTAAMYGARTVAVSFVAADGSTLAMPMQGTDAASTVRAGSMLPAFGSSQGETLTCIGVTAADFVAAAGIAVAESMQLAATGRMSFVAAGGESDTDLIGLQGTDANNPIAYGRFVTALAGSIGVSMVGTYATDEPVAPPAQAPDVVQGGVIVQRTTKVTERVESKTTVKRIEKPYSDPALVSRVADQGYAVAMLAAQVSGLQAQIASLQAALSAPQPMMPLPPELAARMPIQPRAPKVEKVQVQAPFNPYASEQDDIAYVASVLASMK